MKFLSIAAFLAMKALFHILKIHQAARTVTQNQWILNFQMKEKKTHAIEDTMESTTCDGQSSNIEVALRKKQNGEDMTDDPLCDLKVASLARPNENNVYLLTQLETVMLNNKNRHETWDEEGVDLKERVDRMLEKKVRREASDKIDPNRTEVADCKIDPVDLIESSEHGGDGLDRLLEL